MQFFTFVLSVALFFSFGSSTPIQARTSEEILLCLAKRARESNTDALLVIHKGRAIFEYRSDPYWQSIDAMSMTKSIVALVIGCLIDEGAIPSIDTPVYHFYPEWEQGNKRLITIRHLLNHTSGLQADNSYDELYRTSDSVQLALCAELAQTPGKHFFYNNKATNLLSGIVEKASGFSLSEYTNQKLFLPLEIEDFSWQCDTAHHDYAMAHLAMTAPDLAKIGEVVAKKGMYRGQRIVSEKWIDQITMQGQSFNPFSAYLWWIDYHSVECYWDEPLLKTYKICGVSSDFIERLSALQGMLIPLPDRLYPPGSNIGFSRKFVECLGGENEAKNFYFQVKSKYVPVTCWKVSNPKSFSAIGMFGQQLLIFPAKDVIAVRQARIRSLEPGQQDPFGDFGALIEELILVQGYE